MIRLCLALLLLATPAWGADPCTDADLQSTWRIYTDEMDVDGVKCTTSCLFRIGAGNHAVPEVSNCKITFGTGDVAQSDMISGDMTYNGSSGKDNAERYAVVAANWSFAEMAWVFSGEQEHKWGGRPGLSKGAVSCRKTGSVQSAGTIFGNAQVFKNGILVGQTDARIIWRSPANNTPFP